MKDVLQIFAPIVFFMMVFFTVLYFVDRPQESKPEPDIYSCQKCFTNDSHTTCRTKALTKDQCLKWIDSVKTAEELMK
jgi:hypothetical protein